MKHYIKFLVSVLMISGCADNDINNLDGCIEPYISITTAEKLAEDLHFIVSPLKPDMSYSSEFIPYKEDFMLEIFAQYDSHAYHTSYMADSEELKAKFRWVSNLIDNGLVEYKDKDHRFLNYIYAGISEGAKIYADKVIWGRDPGTDLGDMFAIPYYYTDVIVTYPDFSVLYGREDKHPDTFRELMSNRIALNHSNIVSLTFAEIPPEEFDTVTFTVEIPVDVEYYEDYSLEMYELHPNLKPEGRRLLKGSVTIEFASAD